MSNATPWYHDYSDYISGALFGLITLDIFMLLIHGITERSLSDYSMGTLAITIPIMLVWSFERLYSKQEH
ncbi:MULTISPECIES: hypothetical protein [unclassified Oleiphilus]|jgi:hypothetical protein|uniref:hypothetical protein n=1 Tax=unclassified Oleiphilus TaxID=2631174 RepID=UPI0007C32B8D|nr:MULTISPECIES: hypothetical protein [unclassified Oleiphilus]KZY44286.1 hypothetical protein A3732_12685 [Oleiphilus sp. HI0050]KZY76674.1 hypothetical protein A3741_01525 [Oleiphilus sp. HI0069]KZY83745.1 hypothetical protein A3740_05225 [Oleiphilus sp. HI0068]KZY87975.1 hypothetical protein A3743_13065 [Oleiphilus sp. HI0072]KZZ09773.1 hypothetical protein A3749_12780 [Oleiphilus sp. HI0078]KZZ19074.1 hypothetical protein A3752_02295 [Oleiphilus sp. HI0081]KZZ43489.1 hypothetical protein